jgi:SAM-dependent methyltransferase
MKEQQIQEDQYAYPYHYLPQDIGGDFRQHAYWSWGYRYLGGIHVVKRLCNEEDWSSLLDMGCGDGRFAGDLSRQWPERRILGVDYSVRAINLAKAMNSSEDFTALDILRDSVPEREFDVVTLIEVIEHIPPADLNEFVRRAISLLRPGGRLILTVPHRNARLTDKHFQHFDSTILRDLLSEHLQDLHFQPFDFFSRPLDLWFRLMGRTGKYFLVTWQPLQNAFFRYYIRKCLYGDDESRCMRIACVGRKI